MSAGLTRRGAVASVALVALLVAADCAPYYMPQPTHEVRMVFPMYYQDGKPLLWGWPSGAGKEVPAAQQAHEASTRLAIDSLLWFGAGTVALFVPLGTLAAEKAPQNTTTLSLALGGFVLGLILYGVSLDEAFSSLGRFDDAINIYNDAVDEGAR